MTKSFVVRACTVITMGRPPRVILEHYRYMSDYMGMERKFEENVMIIDNSPTDFHHFWGMPVLLNFICDAIAPTVLHVSLISNFTGILLAIKCSSGLCLSKIG